MLYTKIEEVLQSCFRESWKVNQQQQPDHGIYIPMTVDYRQNWNSDQEQIDLSRYFNTQPTQLYQYGSSIDV